MRAMLLRHPWVIALLGTHPTIGPNAMRMGDRTVALLTAAGFPGMALSHASALLTAFAIGSATTQSAVMGVVKRSGVAPMEMVQQLEPYLDRTAADHPNYERWRQENDILKVDPEKLWEESFSFGLERLLDGLELWLTTTTTTTAATSPPAA